VKSDAPRKSVAVNPAPLAKRADEKFAAPSKIAPSKLALFENRAASNRASA
jgi:hypothetical protein